MNSTARAWLCVQRAEENILQDKTAAQVERLRFITKNTTRRAAANGRVPVPVGRQLVAAGVCAHGVISRATALQIGRAQSKFLEEERISRDLLLQEEADARITLLCTMLHRATQRQFACEIDGEVFCAAGDRSSLFFFSATSRLHVPKPFSDER
ncbi:hypothetical protein JKF63_04317 [Porcisia hertigi]|uniref:Uncharacterized protein n=1 Tax=Porcisia hertigi TaxID=2761500 RepID=A0A836LBA3_9TRYP|nr:hypothetical protein JKF63_04317 [Porcisia hertigi]